MYAVGKDIRVEYRETARGGLATTPTGKAVAQRGLRSSGRRVGGLLCGLGLPDLGEDTDSLVAVGDEQALPELLRLGDDDVLEVFEVAVDDLVFEGDGVREQRVVLLLQVADQFDQRGDQLDVGRGVRQVEHGFDLVDVQRGRGGVGRGGRRGRYGGLFHRRFSSAVSDQERRTDPGKKKRGRTEERPRSASFRQDRFQS